MKNGLVLVLLSIFSVASAGGSFAGAGALQMISVGGGYFGSMAAVEAEMLYLLPKGMFPVNSDTYLKVGIALADSKNLSPEKDWRRFAALYVDGVLPLTGMVYIGGGLNYPLKVSDGEVGNLGGEAYFGANFYAYDRNNIYAEAGYGVMRRMWYDRFEGFDFIFGWRYELTPAPKEKAGEGKISEPDVIPIAGAAKDESVATLSTKESVSVIKLQDELERVRNYIFLLDNKIVDARKNREASRVLKLRQMKNETLDRAQVIKERIKQGTAI